MTSLRVIIANIVKANPKLTKQELWVAVMSYVKKNGFHTEQELALKEDELAERLINY